MSAKFIICLCSCLFLNGSFAPVGESKPSAGVYNEIHGHGYGNSIEDSIKYKVAVLADLTKHEQELRLDLHRSKITNDSLRTYAKNIKP